MIEVEAPDGSVVEFPDGTSSEVMANAMRQRFSAPAAPTAPSLSQPPMPASAAPAVAPAPAAPAAPAERTWGDTARDVAAVGAYGMQGVRRGVSNIIGLPVDLMNAGIAANKWAADKIGLGDYVPTPRQNPFGGSAMVDQLLTAPNRAVAGVGQMFGADIRPDMPPPSTTGQRFASRVGEEIGASAVPAGAAIRAGQRGVEAARQLPALTRMFVEPAAIAPGQYLGKEMAAAAAAGTGASAATQALGTQEGTGANNLADFFGAMFGAGSLATGRQMTGPIRNVVGAITGNPAQADRVVRDLVVDELTRGAGIENTPRSPANTEPLVDAIMNGRRISDTVPGYMETTADRTGNAGLAAMEYSRSGGRNSGMYTQRNSENATAVNQALDATAPTGTPGALRTVLEEERNQVLGDVSSATRSAQQAVDTAGQRLVPAQPEAAARGSDIRSALTDVYDAENKRLGDTWAPIRNADQTVDMRPLAQRFDEVRGGLSQAEQQTALPPTARVAGELATGDNPNQPLREVFGLRSTLTDAQRDAAPNQARVAGQHVDAVDQFLADNIPAELRGQYEGARTATREFHDRFTRPQTAHGQTLAEQQGLPRANDASIPGKYVQSDQGRIDDFRALMRDAGDDQRVVGAVRDQILSDVRARGLLDNPAELDAYLGRYKTVLSDPRFNETRDQLSTAAGLRRQLDDATTRQAGVERNVGTPDRPGQGVVGQYLSFGNERSDDAMRTVLGSRDPAKAADELLGFAANQAGAVEGARRAFWDVMEQRARTSGATTRTIGPGGGQQQWRIQGLNNFLNDPVNSAVAERLYQDNPEHLARIREIAGALEGAGAGQRARASNSSGTAQQKQSITPSAETLGAYGMAYQRGQVGGPFIGLRIVSTMARRATARQQATAFEQALDRALIDPDWAALLLKENNPANRAALARGARAFLGNEASTLTDLIAGEQQDPTTDAVMRRN